MERILQLDETVLSALTSLDMSHEKLRYQKTKIVRLERMVKKMKKRLRNQKNLIKELIHRNGHQKAKIKKLKEKNTN